MAAPDPKEKLPLQKPKVGGRSHRFLLDLDARIGHALFAAKVSLSAKWEDYSTFMDRFHVAGLFKAPARFAPHITTGPIDQAKAAALMSSGSNRP